MTPITEQEVEQVVGSDKKLDFSMWHPLDHQPWEGRCRAFYGGVSHHLRLWWDYMRPHPIQNVQCRLGSHDWTEFWEKGRGLRHDDDPAGMMCRNSISDCPDIASRR